MAVVADMPDMSGERESICPRQRVHSLEPQFGPLNWLFKHVFGRNSHMMGFVINRLCRSDPECRGMRGEYRVSTGTPLPEVYSLLSDPDQLVDNNSNIGYDRSQYGYLQASFSDRRRAVP